MRVGGTERPQRMDKERRSACACSPKEQNTDTTKVTRRMAGGGTGVNDNVFCARGCGFACGWTVVCPCACRPRPSRVVCMNDN